MPNMWLKSWRASWDASDIEPQLRGQVLNQPEPHDVSLRVEPQLAAGPRRRHEANSLVLPQRLRMHSQNAGRNANYVYPFNHVSLLLCVRDHKGLGAVPTPRS